MSLRKKPRDEDITNPKLDPDLPTNMRKDPGAWVSGEEPMTSAQASDLKMLSAEARELEAFHETLTQAEASKRIDALKAKLALMGRPPHVA